jgi:putative chitinase
MIIKDFYDLVRKKLFANKLTQKQVNGIQSILEGTANAGITDKRWVAYMLATVYHETARTMQPIEEYGKGKGYDYGKKVKRSRIPYTTPDKLYYGRGLIQCTWWENYQLMGRLLGYDLLNKPEMLLDMKVSVEVMIEGMTKGASSFGDFTGKCLEMYFNDKITDWVNARKIINGLDAADKIAGYAKLFYDALQ